jgi:hypothetical protein
MLAEKGQRFDRYLLMVGVHHYLHYEAKLR